MLTKIYLFFIFERLKKLKNIITFFILYLCKFKDILLNYERKLLSRRLLLLLLMKRDVTWLLEKIKINTPV